MPFNNRFLMEVESMGPLDGIKVLDLTRLLPGGYCTLLLADLGADILKVEDPFLGDYVRWYPPIVGQESAMHHLLNRNKKSITINLKADKGREILYKLVEKYDALIEGFRPGVAKKLGIDYEKLEDINPQLVYLSLTGYGQDGPYRDLPGHDINYIGIAGILGITGERNGPPVIPGVQIADLSGGMFAAFSLLAGIISRDRTGKGQYIDYAMLDGVVSWLTVHAAAYFVEKTNPKRGEMLLSGALPVYNVYETKDGKYISMGSLEDKFWRNLFKAIGREDLGKIDESFRTMQLDKLDTVTEELRKIFLTKNRDEWVKMLWEHDICVGPVYTFEETFNDPQVKTRKMVVELDNPEVGKLKQTGIPIKFTKTPGEIKMRAPHLGEQTKEILLSLGYSEEEIKQLKNEQVI
ncbi:MAG: CaiB/BaiF CoA transferase family protein [Candidatus Jordarchaeum sp.]|uniref:CaiB/BaiF CoA transferase family protein n=1 Tax=Candidatus Jordarchaeum sp. TaxID=2823881 RepID=UPI0040497AEF